MSDQRAIYHLDMFTTRIKMETAKVFSSPGDMLPSINTPLEPQLTRSSAIAKRPCDASCH